MIARLVGSCGTGQHEQTWWPDMIPRRDDLAWPDMTARHDRPSCRVMLARVSREPTRQLVMSDHYVGPSCRPACLGFLSRRCDRPPAASMRSTPLDVATCWIKRHSENANHHLGCSVSAFGNNVERNFVLSTKSKQTQHVQFVSKLSKGRK